MTEFTTIWDKLAKTDPNATKSFKRAGGFSGTAVKPQWVIKRLTEEFGPVGVGWGMGKPVFQTVPTDGEILVYCTVEAWHTTRENVFFGVGGDKVVTQRQSGAFTDDEAFKKAFTDALMNAFKFLGVASDVHMGLFDDNKYVAQMRGEFSDRPAQSKLGSRTDTGPGPVDQTDWWKAEGPGMSANEAKKKGLDDVHEQMRSQIDQLTTAQGWKDWANEVSAEVKTMPIAWRQILRAEAEERGKFLGAIH